MPERAHWQAGQPGKVLGYAPSYAPTNKIRTLLENGQGEILANVREVNRLFRTQSETAPLPRRVSELADVTRGLGLEFADEQRIQRLIADTNVEMTPVTQTQRIVLGRDRIVSSLRAMTHIPSDARLEITKRAMAWWKQNVATEYTRKPEIRASMTRKSLEPTMTKAAHPKLGPVGQWLAEKKKRREELFGKRSLSRYENGEPVLVKAEKGVQVTGHKYEARKPDGHGGWLYKYPGKPGWQVGKGEHEGTTRAPVMKEKDGKGGRVSPFGVHEKAFQPTVEPHEQGGEVHHFHEEVSTHLHPEQKEDHHRSEWLKHKQEWQKGKKSDKPEDKDRAHGHRQAANAHARMHNEKAKARKEPKPQGVPGVKQPMQPEQMAQAQAIVRPGVGRPQPGQPQPGEQRPGFPRGTPMSPPGQARPGQPGVQQPGMPPGQGPPGASGGQPGAPMGPNGQPMGPNGQHAEAGPQHGQHVEPSPEVQEIRHYVGHATKLTGDIAGTQAHVADMQARIKAIQEDAEIMPEMKERLIAQHAAEMTAAAHELTRMRDEHMEALDALEGYRGQHAGLDKLIASMSEHVHGKKQEAPEETDEGEGVELPLEPTAPPKKPKTRGKEDTSTAAWIANFSEAFWREIARGGGAQIKGMAQVASERERRRREEQERVQPAKLTARKSLHPIVRREMLQKHLIAPDAILIATSPQSRTIDVEW